MKLKFFLAAQTLALITLIGFLIEASFIRDSLMVQLSSVVDYIDNEHPNIFEREDTQKVFESYVLKHLNECEEKSFLPDGFKCPVFWVDLK